GEGVRAAAIGVLGAAGDAEQVQVARVGVGQVADRGPAGANDARAAINAELDIVGVGEGQADVAELASDAVDGLCYFGVALQARQAGVADDLVFGQTTRDGSNAVGGVVGAGQAGQLQEAGAGARADDAGARHDRGGSAG